MHVDVIRNHQTAADGSQREYLSKLLRRSYRDEQGRPRKETLANLSALPDSVIDDLRRLLKGETLVSASAGLTIERSLSHGDVALVHAMAAKLGLKELLGPDCRQRDLAYSLIISRVVKPNSKLSTLNWWQDSSLGADLRVAEASRDSVYESLDWLFGQQEEIEKRLAARHLEPGGMVMFDLSSSWMEGVKCPISAFGHSRDGKRGKKQIEYGLLTAPRGIPVAIRVFPGNTSDPKAFPEAVRAVRETFGLKQMVFVGDRGMITTTRVEQLSKLEGADWIGALKAPQIAALARDDGPLQMSLSGTQNFAEFTHEDFPGERRPDHRCWEDRRPGRQGGQQAQGRKTLHPRHRRRRVRLSPGRGEDHRRGAARRPVCDQKQRRAGANAGARGHRRIQEPGVRRAGLPDH